MKNILFILTFLITSVISAQELTKQWEVKGLEAPESVVRFGDFYYVSNVAGTPTDKDGNGYITKVALNGKIEEQQWASGFNAPKGLAVYNNQLYVADIDVVSVVDLTTGKTVKVYKAEGATFLNDVEVSKKGVVYITDTFGGNAIYQIEDEAISLLIKDERLDYPNGLKINGNNLYVASWGVVTDPQTFGTKTPGKIIALNLKDNSLSDITAPTGNLDGLVNYKNGFITSDWIAGGLHFVSKKGEVKKLIDLNSGSADIEIDQKRKLILVPQMNDGILAAYSIN